ncbi:MAG: serine--tRNA ligase, partial [Sphingobacteriales bacterium]|nr:serine--tRNA ligase [Sphingobacteriales bacterium]
MLQIQFIRQNADLVKEKLAIRNYPNIGLVDSLIEMDDELRKIKFASESIQANINSASKEIGMLMAKGEKEAAELKKSEVTALKEEMAQKSASLDELEINFQKQLLLLPNLPHQSVPAGKSAEDNEEVRSGGKIPTLMENAKPHWDIIKDYDLIDFETGAKIAGSGFPLYKGRGAKLQRSLIQFFLDYNSDAGYTEYMPPLMVN